MEQAGTIPRRLIEVSEWGEVFRRPGPVATLCMATPAAVDNAPPRNRLRWDELRRSLEEQGAPAAALGAVDGPIDDAHRSGEGLAVYADGDGTIAVVSSRCRHAWTWPAGTAWPPWARCWTGSSTNPPTWWRWSIMAAPT